MKAIFVIAIIILIFIVIFQIARTSEFISTLRGEEKTRKQSNKINAYLLLAFMILGLVAAWYCNKILYPKTLLHIESASEEGKHIDLLLWINIILTGIVFIITHILLFWFAYKYREQDNKKAYYFPHDSRLELLWTTVPAVVLTVLIVFGLKFWFKITGDPPKNALVVEITGKQFAWEVRYPGKDGVLGKKNFKLFNQPAGNNLGVDFEDPESWDDIHVAEMHLPVGRPVKLVINSMDVVHDVGLAAFRMKMDAVPGIPTTMWFTPIHTTEEMRKMTGNPNYLYEISCDQMCGNGHFSMRGIIVVESETDYNAWLAKQTPEYYSLFPDKNPNNKPAVVAPATDSSKTSTPIAAVLPAKP